MIGAFAHKANPLSIIFILHIIGFMVWLVSGKFGYFGDGFL